MMPTEDFKEMTNKKLVAYCEDNNITIEAKNIKMPNKAELLASIEKANGAEAKDEPQEVEESVVPAYVDPEESLPSADEFLAGQDLKPAKDKTKKQKERDDYNKQYAELFSMKRVMIISNHDSQNRIPNEVNWVRWGNSLVGHNTDKFILGKPWHIRQGAINNIENMMISVSVQNDEGNTVRFESVKAYTITYLGDLSKDELATIGKRQMLRDSSIGEV